MRFLSHINSVSGILYYFFGSCSLALAIARTKLSDLSDRGEAVNSIVNYHCNDGANEYTARYD